MKSVLAIAGVFIVGIAVAFATALGTYHWHHTQITSRLDANTSAITEKLDSRFASYESLLSTTRAFVDTVPAPRRSWTAFTGALNLPQHYPDLRGLALVSPATTRGGTPTCTIEAVSPASLSKSWVGFNVCPGRPELDFLREADGEHPIITMGQPGPGGALLAGLYTRTAGGGWIALHINVTKLMDAVHSHLGTAVLLYASNAPTGETPSYQRGIIPQRYAMKASHIQLAGTPWTLVLLAPDPPGFTPIAGILGVMFGTLVVALLVFAAGEGRRRITRRASLLSERFVQSEVRLAGILHNVHDGIFRTHLDWSLDFANDALAREFGFRDAPDIKVNCPALPFADTGIARELMARLASGEHCQQEEYEFKRKDGSVFTGLVSASPVQVGQRTYYDGAIADISVRKRQEQQIHDLAFVDPVTRLPNRQQLYASLTAEVERARQAHEVMAVMFVDLDRFKLVNDTLGHTAGDELLRSVSGRLASAVREGDFVCRQGGDEFVIYLPALGSTDEIDTIADRIIRSVGRPYSIKTPVPGSTPGAGVAGEVEVSTSPSIGVAVFPGHGADVEILLRHADAAMYEAKLHGRNTYRFYDPAIETHAAERLSLESDLAQAVEKREIDVEYVPIAMLPDLGFCGALARLAWAHPRHGKLGPDSFMNVASQSGLAVDIGTAQLRQVAINMAKFRAAGCEPFPVWVPVSEIQLKRTDLAAYIGILIEADKLQSRWLGILISAGTLQAGAAETELALRHLRTLGVKVGLLDFDPAVSALGVLDTPGLDLACFSGKLLGEPQDSAKRVELLGSAIAAARSRHLTSLVQGVETAEQASELVRLGVTVISGPYFSPVLDGQKLSDFAGGAPRATRSTTSGDKVASLPVAKRHADDGLR